MSSSRLRRNSSPIEHFDEQLIEGYCIEGFPAPDNVAYTEAFEAFADDFVALHGIQVSSLRVGRWEVLHRLLNLRRAGKFPDEAERRKIARRVGQ